MVSVLVFVFTLCIVDLAALRTLQPLPIMEGADCLELLQTVSVESVSAMNEGLRRFHVVFEVPPTDRAFIGSKHKVSTVRSRNALFCPETMFHSEHHALGPTAPELLDFGVALFEFLGGADPKKVEDDNASEIHWDLEAGNIHIVIVTNHQQRHSHIDEEAGDDQRYEIHRRKLHL